MPIKTDSNKAIQKKKKSILKLPAKEWHEEPGHT
jgi:hypothetical protein